jgi:ribonuclease Z
MKTTVRVIGTDTVVPQAGNDTACLLLNGDCLLDTGWNAAIAMRAFDADPMAVDTLFITHCHHDHYLGLPQLLFYQAMRRSERPDRPPLTVVGPKPDIGTVVERALAFLRHEHFPEVATPPRVVALQAGDRFETARLKVSTAPTIHPVVGLCYRFADIASGASLAVTGDTGYHEPLADHVQGVDLLVHEASRGAGESHPNARGGHAGALDAARIARAAGVRRLLLVHYPWAQREAVEAAARSLFPASQAAQPGDLVALPES